MTSPATHQGRQFYTDGPPSGLDRCEWCGLPRSAHGPDYSCPTSTPGRGRVPALIVGSLFAVAGLIMVVVGPGVTLEQPAVSGLGAAFLFCGLTTAVAAAVLIRRHS